ncbi:MAG: hypothetical protein BWY95_00306 [Bacteroidetes bacterium ADurb.BinA104]|nr:MAG: hypothetical protein BWY95_00306 [Bacteroidetes bacterium ADurb.BinA104]
MSTKYLPYLLLFIVLAGALVGAGYLLGRNRNFTTSSPVIHRTTLPVRTTIIRESLPARIDTIYVHDEAQEVASYRDTITEGKATVDLDIKFNKKTDIFSVKTDISVLTDSVYVEKHVYHKPKPIRPSVALGTGFSDEGLNHATLDAGLIFANKYRITVFASTNKTYGVRVGVDF